MQPETRELLDRIKKLRKPKITAAHFKALLNDAQAKGMDSFLEEVSEYLRPQPPQTISRQPRHKLSNFLKDKLAVVKPKKQKDLFMSIAENYRIDFKSLGISKNSSSNEFLSKMESKFGQDKLKEMISGAADISRKTN